MIFTKESIELIRSGQKTETRRIWKVPHVKVGGVYGTRTSRREKEAGYPKIRVTEIRQERLFDITPDGVRREGFSLFSEFKEVWEQLHGKWEPRREVYVVRFELSRSVYVGPRLPVCNCEGCRQLAYGPKPKWPIAITAICEDGAKG